MNLTEFLLARIAEARAVAASLPYSRWGPDPARLLAEYEAKRRIIELVQQEQPASQGHWEGHGSDEYWISDHAPEILRLLALPYADHPDYREEWKIQ